MCMMVVITFKETILVLNPTQTPVQTDLYPIQVMQCDLCLNIVIKGGNIIEYTNKQINNFFKKGI